MKMKKVLPMFLAGALAFSSTIGSCGLKAFAQGSVSGDDAVFEEAAPENPGEQDTGSYGDVSGGDVSGGNALGIMPLSVSGNDFDWERPRKEVLTPSYSTVHDPSIMKGGDGKYYIFGSNQGIASSEDLINWGNITANIYAKGAAEELAESFAWAGYKDGSTNAGQGMALWAPSPIWNPYYENEDGSTGAYMLYYPASSNFKRGCIGFAVSDKPAEGYQYGGTVIYSGFTTSGGPDEAGTTADTIWTNTNIKALVDNGEMEFKDGWVLSDGSYNIGEYPQAIDPCVFFDKEQRLWMVYGSHGSGIWVIELDSATGMCKYPGTDSVTDGNVTVDRYFGYHITSEGEGPFIIYNEESGYYYLNVTYGQISEGYNQRVFRSENPYGPFTDASGNSAVYGDVRNQDELGVKLMGNYHFESTTEYKHGGHDSMIIEDGEWFNIYHQRFNRGWSFSDRIHQLFLNEQGWPCMAVYEYTGGVISETGYAKDEIVGTYEFVNHGSATSSAMLQTFLVDLNEDGSITGDLHGSWSMTPDTHFMEITINGVVYSGVFYLQQDESRAEHKVMTFSAVGSNNEAIWGSRMDLGQDDEKAVQAAVNKLSVPAETYVDLYLPLQGEFGTTITWTSENDSVVGADGSIHLAEGETSQTATLKAVVQKGSASVEKQFDVVVKQVDKNTESLNLDKLYEYTFTTTDGYLTQNTGRMTGAGVLCGGAKVVDDSEQGLCLQTQNAADYLRLSDDTFKGVQKGFTVTAWVKAGGDSNIIEIAGENGTISLNAKLQAVVEAGGKTDSTQAIDGAADEWTYVGLVVNKDGVKVYKNAALAEEKAIDLSKLFEGGFSDNCLVKVGGGNILIDNLQIYGMEMDLQCFDYQYNPENAWVRSWYIDFGPEGSPRWSTFTMMYNTTQYVRKGIIQGYGFTSVIDAYETAAGGNKIRDFVYKAGGEEYVFKMDLPKGKYRVFVYSGNKEAENELNFYFQDDTENVHTQLTPEGVASDNYGGPNTYEVAVPDNVLTITFWGDKDLGEGAITGALNSLEITRIGDLDPEPTPTTEPTTEPTTAPTTEPTTEPTTVPTTEPTTAPTTEPTTAPTTEPTTEPTTVPTTAPTTVPTTKPTTAPTTAPTTKPTTAPTTAPTSGPTSAPSEGDVIIKEPVMDGEAPVTAIVTSQEEFEKILSENVFSKEEKDQIQDGANCTVTMSISDVNQTVSAAVKEQVGKKASGYTVGSYFDISLLMTIVKNGQTVSGPKPLTDLNQAELEIRITVPAELINRNAAVEREYVIVREHQGVYDLLPAVFDKKTGTLSFKSGKYSVYAIAYKDVTVRTDEGSDSGDNQDTAQNGDKTTAPKTGDAMGSAATGWFLVLATAGIGMAVTVKNRRKSK